MAAQDRPSAATIHVLANRFAEGDLIDSDEPPAKGIEGRRLGGRSPLHIVAPR